MKLFWWTALAVAGGFMIIDAARWSDPTLSNLGCVCGAVEVALAWVNVQPDRKS